MAWSFCSSCTSQICYCCSILHNTGMNRQTKEILASSHLRAYNMERRKATNKLRRNEMNFCRKECLPLPQGKKKKKAVISDISVPYLNLLLCNSAQTAKLQLLVLKVSHLSVHTTLRVCCTFQLLLHGLNG